MAGYHFDPARLPRRARRSGGEGLADGRSQSDAWVGCMAGHLLVINHREGESMSENRSDAPSERRGEQLPDDHPTKELQVEPGDCIAGIPPGKLEELAEYHRQRGDVGAGEPVPPDVELV